MILARRYSLLAHALSTASVPTKKNVFFQHNLKQKHPKCSLSNHKVRWRPWSTMIFWYAKKISVCVAPWRLPHGPYTIQNCFHIPEKLHTWPERKKQIYMECDRVWNLRRFRWERHLPHIPKNVIPGHFSWKRKKNCRGGKKVTGNITFASGIRRFYGMRCPFWSADACGVRRSFSSALFFEYACLERPIETAKNSIPNPSPNLDRHASFLLHSVSHHAKLQWPNHSLHVELK